VLETLAAFVAVSAIVICTPGQDTALTIRNTLAGGRRGGIATAAGVSLGQAIWTLAASAGVVAILSASEPAFRALKLAGAAYLVYLGAQSLLAAFRTSAAEEPAARSSAARARRVASGRRRAAPPPGSRPRPSARQALRQGVLSNLGNPKMAVFFASLLPQFAGGGSASFLALLALGLLFCAMTLAWLSLYALAIAKLRRFLAGRVRRVLDAVTGVALMVFGARLAAAER